MRRSGPGARGLAAAVLVAMTSLAGGAWAQTCSMTVQITPVVVSYDGLLEATATFDVSVSNTSLVTCTDINFGIANTMIGAGGAAGSLPPGLPVGYAARFDLAGLDPLPLSSATADRINVALASLAASATSLPTQVTLRIPPGETLPSNQRSFGFVGYAWWSGDGAPGVVNVTQEAVINVQSSFSLNIAGGGAAATLPFGALATGQTRSVMLNVQASDPYRITMVSTLPNPVPGSLQLVGDPNPAWSIPYTATLGGAAFPISTTTPLIGAAGTTGANTVQMEFAVTIGVVGDVRAGVYREVVTLTIGADP